MQTLQAKMEADQKELQALKVTYDDLLEKHQQLSSCGAHQAKNIHDLEVGLLQTFYRGRDRGSNSKIMVCHLHYWEHQNVLEKVLRSFVLMHLDFHVMVLRVICVFLYIFQNINTINMCTIDSVL